MWQCGERAVTRSSSWANSPTSASFRRRDELQAVAMKRCEQFFCSLQLAARAWVSLSMTKTGAVYRLKGNPPQAHE